MKKPGITLVTTTFIFCASGSASAQDGGDCFPDCPAFPEEPSAPLDLCRHALVREGVRLEQRTRPIREVIHIVQNPAGFVIRQVSEHVVHIPPWVNYAIDPRGAIRAKVVGIVRDEVKKSLGVANECRPEATDVNEPADYSAVT